MKKRKCGAVTRQSKREENQNLCPKSPDLREVKETKKGERRVVACQSKKEDNQNLCLPEDIIFKILTRLPAEFLHNYGRNVCQQWADLLNNPIFIESHHSCSNAGLLIQYVYNDYIRFFEVNKGNVVLKWGTRDFSGSLMSSCHGITLFCLSKATFCIAKAKEINNLSKKKLSFYVANIVTKQVIQLPLAPLDHEGDILAAIGYDYLRREFKVICFYTDKDKAYYWLFCTVGKDDAWRKVGIVSSHISRESFDDRWWISAGGVIYGIYNEESEQDGNIIAVDVGDETTWVVNVPDDEEEISGGFLEEKNRLMHITHGLEEETTSVYRLDDFRKSAWVKIYKFQVDPMAHRLLTQCYSLAWVENEQLLLFQSCTASEIGAYNIRTGHCKIWNDLPCRIRVCAISKSLIPL